MGYQVTITRDGSKITEQEWRNYAASDPELKLIDEDWSPTIWLKLNDEPVFHWEDVGVWAWTPDNATILKMIKIAGNLNAKVVGEDERQFILGKNGEILEIEPEDEGDTEDSKTWWRRFSGL